MAGPLTAREVTEDYELRACLEPEALRQERTDLDREVLEPCCSGYWMPENSAECSLEAIEQIEEDLHQRCLAGMQNRKIAALIRQGQSPMIISRIFYRLLGIGADPAMLAEHRLILELLLHGAFDAAASESARAFATGTAADVAAFESAIGAARTATPRLPPQNQLTQHGANVGRALRRLTCPLPH